MPSETLSVDITGNASSVVRAFKETSDGAGVASKAAAELKKRLDDLKGRQATARILLEGDKEAQAALDRIDVKILGLDKRTAKPDIKVEGAAKAAAELNALDLQMDKVGSSSQKTGGLLGALAGGGGNLGGIGALITAGVGLSPVLLTVGLGLTGLAAAAYGIAKPIENAAQQTGGLRANLHALDPEQRTVAQGILGLGQQFAGFQRAVKPEVLGIFNQGLQFAGHVLSDIQPVAVATGKAFEGFLGQIDRSFAGGTWKQFFGFAASTAAPDMQLLGKVFVDLLNDLPPLLEQLQPLGRQMLNVTDGALKVVGALTQWKLTLPLVGAGIGYLVAGPLGALAGALIGLSTELVGLGPKADQNLRAIAALPAPTKLAAAATINWAQVTKDAKAQLHDTATVTGVLGDKAAYAAPKVGTLAGDMAILDAAVASGNSQLAAYNDLWRIFVGASVSDQQAVLNVSQAFDSYNQAASSGKKTSAQVQLAFLSIFDVIGTGLDTLHKNNASVSQVNDFYKTSISRLQSLHGLNGQQKADIQGLIKDYDAWASSTQGLDKNTVTAARDIANQYVVALQGAHHWTPQVSADMTSLAASVLKTGDNSRSTAGDRAKLIQDLEKAGLSASDAKAYVKAFQGQIDSLHGKTVNVGLTTSGHGEIIITGTGITTRTINTTTGQVNAIGGHTANGWLVSGGTPGVDSVPIMAMPGELVVPTRMVNAGAVDHLRGRIPGFAGGGVVGKVAGAEGGIAGAEATWGQLAAQAFASAAFQAAQKAAAAAAATVGAAGGISGAGLSASSGYQAFQQVAARLGWTGALFQDWVNVEMREAGFQLTATNPSSGAYGMAQFINGPSEYYQYGGNPGTYIGQAVAMANYIRQRYGTPAGAWAHELSAGWYDNGGLLKPGFTLAYNGTGRAEQVIPAGGSSGGDVHLHVSINAPVGSEAELERWFVNVINSTARKGLLTYALRRSPSAA